MTIANPIYDSVFKYLMDDSRVARVILSALLKTEVKEVQVRPHEYVNTQRDSLSMFRIDFGAKVRNPDGEEQMILVEVQKTWLETETLRFRQYLGVQYERKENILPNSKEGYAMPMVAIYILGHKVGDIEEPVLYVRHKAYDYNNQPVTKGLPNPFVDSLTHESIIVQIPRLRGQINNSLEKVLAVFDQTRMDDRHGSHYLNIDESLFVGDEDMQAVLHRLLMAAADADMRQDMNVEDEYYSVIEKRDTEIALNAKKIAEQRVQLSEQQAQLSEQQAQLSEQQAQLSEQQAQLSEQQAQLSEQQAQLNVKDAQLAEMDQVIRHSVQTLSKAGMSDSDIADALHIEVERVRLLR